MTLTDPQIAERVEWIRGVITDCTSEEAARAVYASVFPGMEDEQLDEAARRWRVRWDARKPDLRLVS